MKRKYKSLWLILMLCTVFLTVVTHWQERDVVSIQRTESSVVYPQHHQHHEATLTDASQLYRVCSSRPQRILPTHGSRTTRIGTPTFSLVRQHIVKPLHSFYNGRCRMESAPFCLSASCDYYVIALRHIIR